MRMRGVGEMTLIWLIATKGVARYLHRVSPELDSLRQIYLHGAYFQFSNVDAGSNIGEDKGSKDGSTSETFLIVDAACFSSYEEPYSLDRNRETVEPTCLQVDDGPSFSYPKHQGVAVLTVLESEYNPIEAFLKIEITAPTMAAIILIESTVEISAWMSRVTEEEIGSAIAAILPVFPRTHLRLTSCFNRNQTETVLSRWEIQVDG